MGGYEGAQTAVPTNSRAEVPISKKKTFDSSERGARSLWRGDPSAVLLLAAVFGMSAACGKGDGGSGTPDGGGRGAAANSGSAPGEAVTYTVPDGGGVVEVNTGSIKVAFTFPASAAEQKVTLTPGAAGDIGWPEDEFEAVVQMEPEGLVFDDPVLVRPSSGQVLVLTFPTLSERSQPEPLPLAPNGNELELRHFSTLTVVPLSKSSGWSFTRPRPGSVPCSDPLSNGVTFASPDTRFCWQVGVSCCPAPETEACLLGDPQLTHVFVSTEPQPEYPYCRDSGTGSGDAGTGSGSGTSGSTEGGGSGIPPVTIVPRVDVGKIDNLDLLLVVESGSMMRPEARDALQREFPKLISVLSTGDRPPKPSFPPAENLHLGVVSTDMGGCANSELGDDGIMNNIPDVRIANCQPTYPRFLTYLAVVNDPTQTATDFACIAGPNLALDGSVGDQECGDPFPPVYCPAETLSSPLCCPYGDNGRTDVCCSHGSCTPDGVCGCEYAQPLEAALKALWPSIDIGPDGNVIEPNRIMFRGDAMGFGQLSHGDIENDHFLRNDATLGVSLIVIMLVTDKDDSSPYDVQRYVNGLKLLRPGAEQLVMFGAIAASCSTDFPSQRIAQVAQAFGEQGMVQSICQDDFGPAIDAIIDWIGDRLAKPGG